MKKLGIKIGSDLVMFPPAATQLLGYLGEAFVCRSTWANGRSTWVRTNDAPNVVFMDEADFEAEPAPMEQLRKEKEDATKNWLAAYNTSEDLRKELKEVKDKLAKLQEAVKE